MPGETPVPPATGPARPGRGAGGAASYAHVAYPWRAAFATGSPHPVRFYAALVSQTLRYGLPARRRFGPAVALAARRGVPVPVVAQGLRRAAGRPGPRADLDELLAAVAGDWQRLAARSVRLPPRAPADLHALALQRRAGLTVFVFGDAPGPLVVLKRPEPGHGRVEHEAALLEVAAPAAVGPTPLGQAGGAWAQEGLPGAPLDVTPLTPARAARLGWPPPLGELEAALVRLAQRTAARVAGEELGPAIERALATAAMSPRARAGLAAAWDDVRRLDVAVLRHRDTGPQNCLYDGSRFSGLVDWEYAVRHGAPGHDMLNAAVSYLDLGVGLQRWSQDRVVDTFAAAWAGPFGTAARASARRTALAVDVPERLLEPLEVVFFGWRVGQRVGNPVFYPTGADTAARMLEAVVA